MAPQELLGIMDGLSDYVAVSQETWRQNTQDEKVMMKKKESSLLMEATDNVVIFNQNVDVYVTWIQFEFLISS